jgi:hypothetical protein
MFQRKKAARINTRRGNGVVAENLRYIAPHRVSSDGGGTETARGTDALESSEESDKFTTEL